MPLPPCIVSTTNPNPIAIALPNIHKRWCFNIDPLWHPERSAQKQQSSDLHKPT